MTMESDSSGLQTYLRLLRYVGRYWLAFLISVLGLFMHSAAEIAFVDLLGYITDTVGAMNSATNAPSSVPSAGITSSLANAFFGESKIVNGAVIIPLFLILISIVRGLGYLIGSYGLAYVSNFLVHALRTDILKKYLHLPSDFFNRSMSGHLVSVVTFNVQQVTEAGTKAKNTVTAGQFGAGSVGLFVLYQLEVDPIFYCGNAVYCFFSFYC